MNYLQRNALLMAKLGIEKIEPLPTENKAEQDWLVTMKDQTGWKVTLHRFSTESGVLREMAKRCKPVLL